MVRALKYLEAYGQRQSQFTVLEKYHQLSNGLEDLKSQFHFLKEVTSRNIENLQQVINVQQTSTTNLCGHINVILSRITKLEANIQKFTQKFMMEQDIVQIDSPDFDPDINGPDTQWVHHTTAVVSVHELFTSPEPESVNASNTQEETTDRNQFDTRHSNSEDPLGLAISPNKFQTIHLKIISQDNNRSPQETTMVFNEIPQLKEDWKNGQFTDADTNLINRHNTHSESERI